MKVYCGDYMNYKPPRVFPWRRAGLILACLLITTAATPAMISYHWNGQNGTQILRLEQAKRIFRDAKEPVGARKSAEITLYITAKGIVKDLKEVDDPTGVLERSAVLLLNKLKNQIEAN